MEKAVFESFVRDLERVLAGNDRGALYEMMDEKFRRRVKREYFLRLEKYLPDMRPPLRIEKICLHGDEHMLRVSWEEPQGGRVCANMFLSEHNGNLKISKSLGQRD